MKALLTGATAVVAALALATPATAAPVVPEDHAMGSQIAKHEGGGDRRIALDADPSAQAVVYGIDVSGHQGNVDWAHWWGQGKRFAYVKATESTTYRNPYFAQQYNGSYNVGMIRGAYHFALPDKSSGATQADYFVNNGGGWSRDGKTLPGALDMEYNPYGATCYGLSKASMVAWIRSFSDRYQARTGRWPVIYTSTSWWNQCASGDFSSTNPLWVARYSSSVGTLPYNWGYHTFWQYSSAPIDQNQFNGAADRLRALANG
ncbi:lysozyme [Actinosynnema sp. NPDC047251]|uniref:Lysozyme n=1 Tax=Saccharothrix espanaensis (strain ATCC 51144 / DSM 44229 / JCM 9112 / NBRC 15066 / NRRL 15764) TaxID=1179773 RepID=K0KD15_SACES|nr:lysozyme [Saccharothrix espanaensis]CCH35467.1 Lysozyme M1 [Saccharothrix espanaensis DSM 44229]